MSATCFPSLICNHTIRELCTHSTLTYFAVRAELWSGCCTWLPVRHQLAIHSESLKLWSTARRESENTCFELSCINLMPSTAKWDHIPMSFKYQDIQICLFLNKQNQTYSEAFCVKQFPWQYVLKMNIPPSKIWFAFMSQVTTTWVFQLLKYKTYIVGCWVLK